MRTPDTLSRQVSGDTARRPAPAVASFWQTDAGRPTLPEPGSLPATADFVVIGAGLAGLMTAIRLKELAPDARVVVLEAKHVGFGASGRSGGLLSPLAAPVWLTSAQRHAERRWGMKHMNRLAREIADWLTVEVPEAEVSASALRLEAKGRLTRCGLDWLAEVLKRSEIAHDRQVHTGGRQTAYIDIPASTVQPYRMTCGLARLAVEREIEIYEGTAVTGLEKAEIGATCRIEGDQLITARRIIVCTNGYTDSLDLGEKTGARPVHNFMLATAPLEAAMLDEMPSRPFTVELNTANAYHRLYQGRVVFGGIDKFSRRMAEDFDVPDDIYAKLLGLFANSYPTAANAPIDSAWGGCFHQTANDLPVIRQSVANPAVVLNVGYGGTGLVLTLALARIAAATAISRGYANGDDARLHRLISGTRAPVFDGLRVATHVGWRVLRSLFGR